MEQVEPLDINKLKANGSPGYSRAMRFSRIKANGSKDPEPRDIKQRTGPRGAQSPLTA